MEGANRPRPAAHLQPRLCPGRPAQTGVKGTSAPARPSRLLGSVTLRCPHSFPFSWEHLGFCWPSVGRSRGHGGRKRGTQGAPPGDGKMGQGSQSGVASSFLLAWPRHLWRFIWWLSHEAMLSPPHAPRLALDRGGCPQQEAGHQLLAFPVQGTPTLTLCRRSLPTSLPGLHTPWHGCLAGDKSPGPCSRQDELRSHSCPGLPVGPG